MRYIWDLVWHFISSNSRHGTHSPFVYRLTEEAIYQKSYAENVAGASILRPKNQKLVSRIAEVLGKDKIVLLSLEKNHQEAEILLCRLSDLTPEGVRDILRNENIILLEDMYKSTHAKAQWQELLQMPEIIVSIDLFHLGILMQRSGQVKENFKLRFPYWLT